MLNAEDPTPSGPNRRNGDREDRAIRPARRLGPRGRCDFHRFRPWFAFYLLCSPRAPERYRGLGRRIAKAMRRRGRRATLDGRRRTDRVADFVAAVCGHKSGDHAATRVERSVEPLKLGGEFVGVTWLRAGAGRLRHRSRRRPAIFVHSSMHAGPTDAPITFRATSAGRRARLPDRGHERQYDARSRLRLHHRGALPRPGEHSCPATNSAAWATRACGPKLR